MFELLSSFCRFALDKKEEEKPNKKKEEESKKKEDKLVNAYEERQCIPKCRRYRARIPLVVTVPSVLVLFLTIWQEYLAWSSLVTF